jgi:hypothetical protein
VWKGTEPCLVPLEQRSNHRPILRAFSYPARVYEPRSARSKASSRPVSTQTSSKTTHTTACTTVSTMKTGADLQLLASVDSIGSDDVERLKFHGNNTPFHGVRVRVSWKCLVNSQGLDLGQNCRSGWNHHMKAGLTCKVGCSQ